MEGHLLRPINLSDCSTLESKVEHRRVFNLPNCELNIFETFQQTADVQLSYNGLVVSSMMRGRKTMVLQGSEQFDFLPGETVILPEGVTMNVGFPEVDEKHPVQCATVALDWAMVNKNLNFLNEQYPKKEAPFEWQFNFSHYHFVNNKELASSINKLINISMEESMAKEALADLAMKMLILRIIQTQQLACVQQHKLNSSRLQAAVRYIQEHLSEKITIAQLAMTACMSQSAFFQSFRESFGISPLEYVLKARIEQAKKLMADPQISVTEVCYASGFNNLNHFSKLFKRMEGISPKQYRG
jgi:AraC-like DNA-binding protein